MATKKLSSGKILSLHSKTFTQKVINIIIGNDTYAVTIDVKFQPTKLQHLVLELVEKYQQISKIDDIFDISYYANFLIIKYFTDIDVAKTDDFEKQIRVFKALVDLEIFDKIISEFSNEEIDKINTYIKKVGENFKKLEKDPTAMDDISQMIAGLSKLENPEVFMDSESETPLSPTLTE